MHFEASKVAKFSRILFGSLFLKERHEKKVFPQKVRQRRDWMNPLKVIDGPGDNWIRNQGTLQKGKDLYCWPPH
jgi:hypothetical protein